MASHLCMLKSISVPLSVLRPAASHPVCGLTMARRSLLSAHLQIREVCPTGTFSFTDSGSTHNFCIYRFGKYVPPFHLHEHDHWYSIFNRNVDMRQYNFAHTICDIVAAQFCVVKFLNSWVGPFYRFGKYAPPFHFTDSGSIAFALQ